jgi:hypothetical protein
VIAAHFGVYAASRSDGPYFPVETLEVDAAARGLHIEIARRAVDVDATAPECVNDNETPGVMRLASKRM